MDSRQLSTLQQLANLESEVELKSNILQLDIARDFDFFKKDLVLGNIDNFEKRFIDIVFDLISDMKHFANIIIERQYKTMSKKYLENEDYRRTIDGEVGKYNTEVKTLEKELNVGLESSDTSKREKEEIEYRLANLKNMSAAEYLLAAAKHEGVISFFAGASEKLIIVVYQKLATSRSKDGYQQKMILTKRISQKYTESIGKKKGWMQRGGE